MRLIDADALTDFLKCLFPDRGMWEIEGDPAKDAICETVADAIEMVKNMETIDPRPRGRWLYASDSDGEHYYCSRCEGELPRYSLKAVTWDNPYPHMQSIDKTDYCPRCGADMRQRGGTG